MSQNHDVPMFGNENTLHVQQGYDSPSTQQGQSTPSTQQGPSMQELLQQLEALQNLVNQRVTNQSTATSPKPAPHTGGIRPKKKIAELSEYDGSSSEWEHWNIQAKIKLDVDGHAMGTPHEQYGYLFSRLRGHAAQTMVPYADEHSENVSGNPHEFLKLMDQHFGDPMKQQRAQSQLSTIRQGKNESFAKFASKFDALLAKCKGFDWPETIKVSMMKNAISVELRDRIVGLNHGQTYAEFKNLLFRISNDLASNRAVQSSQARGNNTFNLGFSSANSYHHPVPRTPALPDPDPMDWNRTNNTRPTGQPRKSCGCPGTHTCGRKRATWVPKESINYRRAKNLCLRCGNSGHMQAQCSLLPAVPPNGPVRTNQSEVIDPTLARPEMVDEEEDDSGNE